MSVIVTQKKKHRFCKPYWMKKEIFYINVLIKDDDFFFYKNTLKSSTKLFTEAA